MINLSQKVERRNKITSRLKGQLVETPTKIKQVLKMDAQVSCLDCDYCKDTDIANATGNALQHMKDTGGHTVNVMFLSSPEHSFSVSGVKQKGVNT